jgi:hypothetical protein
LTQNLLAPIEIWKPWIKKFDCSEGGGKEKLTTSINGGFEIRMYSYLESQKYGTLSTGIGLFLTMASTSMAYSITFTFIHVKGPKSSVTS